MDANEQEAIEEVSSKVTSPSPVEKPSRCTDSVRVEVGTSKLATKVRHAAVQTGMNLHALTRS